MKRISKTLHKPLTEIGRLRIGLSLVWLLVWLLLLVAGSCTQTDVEEDVIPPHALKDVEAGFNLNVLATRTPVTRSITFTPDGTIESDTLALGVKDSVQTKAATSLTETEESQIASLWVGQYDAATGTRLFNQYLSSLTGTTVNLKLKQSQNGSRSRVYFVSNADDLGEIADTTTLKKQTLAYTSTAAGLPDNNLCKMMGTWEGVVEAGGVKDITVELTRLLAKITFTYSMGTGFTFTPTVVQLKNAPTLSQVAAPMGQLTTGNSYNTYTGTGSNSGATVYWYLPENMAGTVDGENAVDSEKKKIGTGVANATYIELTGDAVQGGVTYQNVTFKFYPGSDKNNYDILRNAHYTMTVKLIGIDISDERITVGSIPPIVVDPEAMPAKKGGEKTIQIITRPGQKWIFNMPPWLSAVLNGQNFSSGATLTHLGPANVLFKAAEANPKAETRSVSFNIDVNGTDQAITITQAGSTLAKGSNVSLTASADAEGTSSFTATGGLQWSAALSEGWLGWSDTNPGASGSEAPAGAQALMVKATASNPSASQRSGTITVKAGASVGDATYTGLKQEIAVNQAGSTVGGSTANVNAEAAGGQSSFTATAGLDWALSVASGSWITLTGSTSGSPTTGSTQTATFNVAVNPSSSQRQKDITVRAGDVSNGPTNKITVTQAGAALSVSGANTVAATASATDYTSTFSATKGLSWSVSDNMNWLTLKSTTSGTDNTTGGNQEIKYSVVVNPNAATRNGNITVKAGNAITGTDIGLTKTISVTQSGSTFTVDKDEIELANTATSGSVTVTGTSGLPWTVSPNVTTDGLTPATTSSTAIGSAQTLEFTATKNTGSAREATFTIAVTGGNHSKTVKVKQKVGLPWFLTIDQSVLTSYRTKTTDMTMYPPFNYDGSDRLPNGSTFNGTDAMTGSYTIQVEKGQRAGYTNYATMQSYCSSLTEDGLSGWRIPTQIELHAMYINKAKTEGSTGASAFISDWYWSSSVSNGNSSNRCELTFSNGNFYTNVTSNRNYVRCVRDTN